MDETTTLVAIFMTGTIGLVVGGLAGFLLSGLRTPPPPVGAPPTRHHMEVLRLWRDRRNARLSVEINGKTYPVASDMSVKLHTSLSTLPEELRAWLGSLQ